MKTNLYKKKHKKKYLSVARNYLGNVQFGIYGIKAIEPGFLLFKELEVARRLISRLTKRVSKVWLRVFFIHPLTKKSIKSRMGKGVGSVKLWVSYIKKGSIILEISYISETLVNLVFKVIQSRLALKTNLIVRNIYKK